MEVKGTPTVTQMRVISVAGYDSMLMTLSGAHAPWFTRNLVITMKIYRRQAHDGLL